MYRWPRLFSLLLQERPASDLLVDLLNPQWLLLACQRMEITAKVHTELSSMPAICYPHGEPPLVLMDSMISNSNFDFVEDELLKIIFHTNEYINRALEYVSKLNFFMLIKNLFSIHRNDFLTLKHYGSKVLNHMRTAKLEARWRGFFLAENPSNNETFLEKAVLFSQLERIVEENLPSLPEINRSIDVMVKRVTRLVSTCSTKSLRKTITFINQVLLIRRNGFQ